MPQHKRRKNLILPRLQLRLILAFFAASSAALLLQFLMFANLLTQIAAQLPDDGPLAHEILSVTTLRILAFSFAFLLPLTFTTGVLVTFKVAGPLYRFEQHLDAIARGEDPGPCRIRKGDELQRLCAALNAAMERLQNRQAVTGIDPGRLERDRAA